MPAHAKPSRPQGGIWGQDRFRCEGVDKLTDNRPARFFVTAQVADTDFPEVSPFRWPRRTPPHPLPRWGQRDPAHVEPDRFQQPCRPHHRRR